MMGTQVIYYLPLDPFPALPLLGSATKGMNYISQAPLPTSFLLSLANGRYWQIREQRWAEVRMYSLHLALLQFLAVTPEDGLIFQCPNSLQAATGLGLQ